MFCVYKGCLLPKHLFRRSPPTQEQARLFEFLTNAQRQFLAGLGVTNRRRAGRALVESKAKSDAHNKLRGNMAVLWADNYNKLRYASNPMFVNEGHVNATAIALAVALPGQPNWTGQPTLQDMLNQVEETTKFLVHQEKLFTDDLKVHVQTVQRYTEFRVPPDYRRWQVTSVEWLPYAIIDAAVGSNDGMVEVLKFIGAVGASLDLSPLAILSDVNVFYRILKVMHTKTFWMCGASRALARHPLLFGVWHSYANLVKKTYHVFRPY